MFGEDGYFRDRGDDYLRSEAIEPLQYPEGVKTERVQAIYGIPEISNEDDFDSAEEFEVPRPQSLSANLLEETVKIQKLAGRRWILVNVPPSEVWPQLRSFLAQNNLDVVYADTNNGILETSWIQFKDDLSKKDKFRLQIDQGVQPDTSEIHITHMNIDSSIPAAGQVNWPLSSMDPEREAILLDELAATLASDMSGSTSMLAQNIGSTSKVNLAQDAGEPILKMQLEFKRAWATLGYSTNQEGYTTFDDDIAVGVYYVTYIKPVEESDSWFSWGSSEPKMPRSPYSLAQVLSHLPQGSGIFSDVTGNNAKPLDDVPGYLIVIRGDDFDIDVRIRDGYGKKLAPKQARKLLKILRRNLI
jgi:outer membrane protein assembly factor BamC